MLDMKMRARHVVGTFMAFALLLPSVVGAISPPSFGFRPAELNDMKRNGANPADVRALLAGVDSYIVQLARRNRVPERAVRGSLTQKIIRTPAIDRTFKKAVEQAEESAKQIITLTAENSTLRANIAQFKDEKLRTSALVAVAEAQRAIDEGRLDDASSALQKLQPLRLVDATDAGNIWATVVEMKAGVAALQGDYDLQKLIGDDAYTQDVRTSRERQWKFKMISADASFRKGKSTEDSMLLALAIRIYRDEALPLAPRNERPDHWATTKGKLGISLWQLGAGQTDPANIKGALVAFDEALEVITVDKSPELWADTQIYRGNALLSQAKNLGAGIAGNITSKDQAEKLLKDLTPEFNRILGDAKFSYLDAMKIYTPIGNKYKNSIIKNNLVGVLIQLDGIENLEEARNISEDILVSNEFAQNSVELAGTYDQLGHTYGALFRNKQDMTYFEKSKTAYESAISIWSHLGLRNENSRSQVGISVITILTTAIRRDSTLLDGAEMRLITVRNYAQGTDSILTEQANFNLQLINYIRSQWKADSQK